MSRLLELEPNGLFGPEAILTSLSGREEISRPFEFSLTIASPKSGDSLKLARISSSGNAIDTIFKFPLGHI